MENEEKKTERLCTEIQLFDLCSKEECQHRKGRYCTAADILARFEAISDDEDQVYLAEEDEGDEDEGLDYEDDLEPDECNDDLCDEKY